jgi:hypothetical protein
MNRKVYIVEYFDERHQFHLMEIEAYDLMSAYDLMDECYPDLELETIYAK